MNASVNPDDVLPARHRDQQVVAPVEVLDELALSSRHRISIVRDASGAMYVVPMVGDRRAVPGDGVAAAAIALLAAGSASSGRFEITSWFGAPVEGERAIAVDQSNESIVVGQRAVVKWNVRGGVGPAPQRLISLTAAGFHGMPRPWGLIRWRGAEGGMELVATTVEYLPGAVDGWTWAVDDARAFAGGRLTDDAASAVGTELGVLVAELHCALAADGVTAAEPAIVTQWSAAARAELADAVGVIDGPEGARLAARRDEMDAVLARLATAAGTPTIAVHGDLHVGQLLRFGEPARYCLTDFDGNPVLPAAQRLLPQPAAADVASMLQSFDHVGRVVLHRPNKVDTEGVDPQAVDRWVSLAQTAFLAAYRRGLGAELGLLDESLIGPFRLRQVCREYLYAARHLPHWRYVPDTALPPLLAELR